jgi:hypothetical protein
MPAGSVRAILALAVLVSLWLLTLFALPNLVAPDDRVPVLYLYLLYLMMLILASFFAAHGSSIKGSDEERSPLFLPRRSVRIILLLGFLGLVAWLGFHASQLFAKIPDVSILPLLVLVSAFCLGYLITWVVDGLFGGLPYWFLDILGWVALLAVLGLGVELLYYLVIREGVPEANRPTLDVWEGILAGIFGFYFGARSKA